MQVISRFEELELRDQLAKRAPTFNFRWRQPQDGSTKDQVLQQLFLVDVNGGHAWVDVPVVIED